MILLTPSHMMTFVIELTMTPGMNSAEKYSNEWNHSHDHQDFIHTKMERHVTF